MFAEVAQLAQSTQPLQSIPGVGSVIIWDWGTMASISLAFTAVGSLSTWLWNRGGKAALVKAQIDTYERALKDANDRTDKVQMAYDKLLADLHGHMLSDAASFAKLEAVASTAVTATIASETRLTAAMDKLGTRIDGMAERFDAFLSNRPYIMSVRPAIEGEIADKGA